MPTWPKFNIAVIDIVSANAGYMYTLYIFFVFVIKNLRFYLNLN